MTPTEKERKGIKVTNVLMMILAIALISLGNMFYFPLDLLSYMFGGGIIGWYWRKD